jgi:AcrR family transcriptional regulator
MADDTAGRPNQRRRTRKDLLLAASRLLRQGRKPSLEDVAAEAMVSRATAYRYFPSVEALILEAGLDQAAPNPATLFTDGLTDPVARVQRADTALHDMTVANEIQIRMMLANSLQRSVLGVDGEAPIRQNRRTPLIEAALGPSAQDFDPVEYDRLCKALAVLFGTEAMIVFKDVLQVDDVEARAVKAWAIRALVAAAQGAASGRS